MLFIMKYYEYKTYHFFVIWIISLRNEWENFISQFSLNLKEVRELEKILSRKSKHESLISKPIQNQTGYDI